MIGVRGRLLWQEHKWATAGAWREVKAWRHSAALPQARANNGAHWCTQLEIIASRLSASPTITRAAPAAAAGTRDVTARTRLAAAAAAAAAAGTTRDAHTLVESSRPRLIFCSDSNESNLSSLIQNSHKNLFMKRRIV